ncbi:MAG: biotin--[acetyl-CoA-carboxylase] ligase [Phycisphaerales bacterium]|nr:biotin--[acetyl-CoA-carboxylase] ligase [Phycisphaerales bacterium]
MNTRAGEFAALQRAGEHAGRRVIVVDRCESTQDIAKDYATRSDAGPGVAIIARRQTAGRGRLGRAWADTAESGLAMSLTLDARAVSDPGLLSIGVGLAACQACEFVLKCSPVPDAGAATAPKSEGPPTVIPTLGLRWPNDVVERSLGRKLAGILIERSADVFIIGIGINCLQRDTDWPEALRARAVSLLELQPRLDRASLRALIAGEVLRSIDRVLALPHVQIARDWFARDTLVGSRRVFEHAGARVRGLVESIDPLSHLIVRDDTGSLHRLPALTTSMVHDEIA